jgi:predicted aldo/keto reductase-like oxidoreductase
LTSSGEMQYRVLGKTGCEVSVISLGAMRLPKDVYEGTEVVSHALALGMNYVDAAPGYVDGKSEVMVGTAVREYRRRNSDGRPAYISTKNWVGKDKTASGFRERLEGSLKTLGVDSIDFYNFWNMQWEQFNEVIAPCGGPLSEAKKAKSEGLIQRICFTSHDTPENVIRIIDTGEFETVTVHYHMVNRAKEPAIAHAHRKGLGVVIMTPLGGGMLMSPSKELEALLPDGVGTTAELGLRFVISNPSVTCAISGMTTKQEVDENFATGSHTEPLSQEERVSLEKALRRLENLAESFCTACGYCSPCPQEVNIPEILSDLLRYKVYGLRDWALGRYHKLETGYPWIPGKKADKCTECGECEPRCPNKIPIIEQLKEARETFGDEPPEETPKGIVVP